MTDKRRIDRRKPPRTAARRTPGSCAGWTAALAAGLGLASAVEAAHAQTATADAPTVTRPAPPAATADAPAVTGPAPPAATAEPAPPTVTLADALRQALRPDNPALELQSDNVAGAAGSLQAAGGQFDWRADASAGWQQYYVARASTNGGLTNQTAIVTGYTYTADVAKEFRNGVQIAPGVEEYPTPGLGAGSQTLPLLGLKIPFLRGSGASVDAPEQAAREALKAARASRAFAEQQLAQEVAATYWRCIADARLADAAEETRQHGDDYGSTLQQEVKKGLIEPNALQQFTLSHLSDKLNVEHARDEEAHCRRDLGALLTGTPEQAGAPAPVGDLPDVAALGPAVDKLRGEALILLALDQRPDLEAAARNLAAAHENVVGAKTLLLPQLDVSVDPQRAFVTFSRPFGNDLGKGKTEAAHAQENAAIATLRQLQDQVRTQVDDSLNALRRARSDWMTLAAAEAQMTPLVSDTEKRARLGTATWDYYLNAQNQLTQLKQQEINTRLVFALNLSLLELAIGAIDPDQPTELAQNLAKVPTMP